MIGSSIEAQVLAVIPRTQPLLPGTLVQRYKRFLSDIRLDSGEVVVAHCVNTGAMEGITTPGMRVWVSESSNPARKLKYTWELADVNGDILGVNTSLPNRIVHQLLRERQLPWLAYWPEIRPEKKYGEKSRVDFWLTKDDREHFLEVKNCHLVYPDACAYFPDCVSARAAGHLEELVHCCTASPGRVTAEVLFFVQMPNVLRVRPSDVHDTAFAKAARRAHASGVKFSAIGIRHTESELIVYGPLLVDLEPYDLTPVAQWRAGNR